MRLEACSTDFFIPFIASYTITVANTYPVKEVSQGAASHGL